MARYIYDGSGRFWPGLPARDLDDADLGEGQLVALKAAVAAKAYKRAATPVKESKHGSKHEAESDQCNPPPRD